MKKQATQMSEGLEVAACLARSGNTKLVSVGTPECARRRSGCSDSERKWGRRREACEGRQVPGIYPEMEQHRGKAGKKEKEINIYRASPTWQALYTYHLM